MNKIISIEKSKVNKMVIKEMRRDIILFKYKDNEQIKEIELAERYDCSRAMIRNTLLILEKEGLITAYNNGTKTVSCLNTKDICNLYEFRLYIEQTSVEKIFDEKIEDFSLIFDAINKIKMTNDINTEEMLETDMIFHTAVIKTCNNKILTQSWINIVAIFREIFSLNMTQSDEYKTLFAETFKQRHIELMNVLLNEKEQAVRLFKSHISEAFDTSKKAIGQMWNKQIT